MGEVAYIPVELELGLPCLSSDSRGLPGMPMVVGSTQDVSVVVQMKMTNTGVSDVLTSGDGEEGSDAMTIFEKSAMMARTVDARNSIPRAFSFSSFGVEFQS